MPLQFDSTVNYALKADKEIVTYEDLGADSPYNTYKNTGPAARRRSTRPG